MSLSRAQLEDALFRAAQQAKAAQPADAVAEALLELPPGPRGPADKYLPLRELGKGGSASVALVRVQATDLKAALKRVPIEEGDGPGGELDVRKVKHVLTEAHVLLSLSSSSSCPSSSSSSPGGEALPRLYDLFLDGPDACLVTSAAEGGDLLQQLRTAKDHSVPEAQVKRWLVELAGSLDRIHRGGFAYVDLKPENVLLREDEVASEGTGRSIMLVDYGLCCPLGGGEEGGSGQVSTAVSGMLAEARRILEQREAEQRRPDDAPSFWGTAEYTAPEVIEKGSAAFSPLSDFWSLGIFAYEMLYGKTPFRGMSLEQTFHNIRMRGPQFPPLPGEAGGEVSYDMQQLVRALLRQKAEYRLGVNGGVDEILQHRALKELSKQKQSGKDSDKAV